MEHTRQCGDAVFAANFWREFEHAHEHGWNGLCMGHVVALDATKEILGIKVIHYNRCSTCAVHRHVPAQRRSVVQRSRGQINGVFVKRKQKLPKSGQCVWRSKWTACKLQAHTFWSTSRAA